MAKEKQEKPKLTDADCHKRFVAMAKEVGASEKAEDFERALEKLKLRESPSPKTGHK